MGDYWWIWLLGAVMFATVMGVAVFGGRVKQPNGYCQECGHAAGLADSRFGRCCTAHDDASGLASARCYCTNDFHWNYESTAASRGNVQ